MAVLTFERFGGSKVSTRNYGLVNSIEELSSLCQRLFDGDGPIGFDVETGFLGPDKEKHSLHPETAVLVGISFTNDTTWARYAPLAHDLDPNLDNVEAARLLWPVLNSGRGVAHNAVFELRHLSRWFMQHLADDPIFGDQVRATDGYFPIRSDTVVEAYLAAEFQSFGLKFLVKELFGHTMTELHELFPDLPKNKRKFLRFNVLELTPQVISYACEDALWCLAVHRRYYNWVKTMQVVDCPCHPNSTNGLLYHTEISLLDCVCEMEDFGVLYDWAYMRRTADALRSLRDSFNAEIMAELTDVLGTPTAINLASPQQLSDVLFTKLGLKTSVYTDKTRDLPAAERRMSTGKVAMAGLAKKHPVVAKIRQWKEMTRLLGTYLDKYEGLYAYAADGRTHPHHLSAFVVTGRFAVADPPYQQSPKMYHFDLAPAREAHVRHAEAHGAKCTCDEFPVPPEACFKFNFRDCIIAPPEHYILGFDLSQAELRAIAGEAKETALIRAFETGQDVHSLTAALMLKIPIGQITKELRDIGKTMNFALLYGMSPKGLADRLGISEEEAQGLYNSYFQVYSGIAAYKDKQIQHGKTYGFVVSRFGRRLPIWEYKSDKRWIYNKGDRACVNYPIQGAATGDLVKIGMVRARRALRDAGLHDRVHMVMNIHDALEFYVHQSVQPYEVISVLQPAVIFPVPGWPPMQADWHIGRTWGSPREIDVADDGRLFVKGRDIELVPTIEVDEETGEEIIELPEVDPDALRQVIAPVLDPATRTIIAAGAGRRVLVALNEMPDEYVFRRFLDFLDTRPGPNTLTLVTLEGDLDLCTQSGTDLGPADTATVSMHLGPCRIVYHANDIDVVEMVQDLDL